MQSEAIQGFRHAMAWVILPLLKSALVKAHTQLWWFKSNCHGLLWIREGLWFSFGRTAEVTTTVKRSDLLLVAVVFSFVPSRTHITCSCLNSIMG